MRNYQTKQNAGGAADTISAERFGAGEFNSIAVELENAVSTSGQTLAPADGTAEVQTQLARALAIYGAGGGMYHIDTGAVNAYVLNPVSPKQSPSAYFDGMLIVFEPTNDNTGASTVNIASLGIKSITYSDGSALVGGEITGSCTIKYNLANDRFEFILNDSFAGSPILSKNYILNGHFTAVRDVGPIDITTSAEIKTADGWATFQNGTAESTDEIVASGITGDDNALRIGRNPGSSEVGAIGAQFAMTSYDSIPLAGKTITLKVRLKAGANFSGANVNVGVASGTGFDQAVESFGGWTGFASIVGVAQVITSSWVEYTFTGTVSSTAKQIGVRFYYTPTGTAGADDNLYIASVGVFEGAGNKQELPENNRGVIEILRLRPVNAGRFSNLGGSDPFPDCHFVPAYGNVVIIDNRYEIIPSGAIASTGGVQANYENCYLDGVASQTLVDQTFYYAYLFMNNGVMTIDFSTTGPAVDPRNGTFVKSGNTTRALIGILRVKDVGGTLVTYGGARGQTVGSLFNPFDWTIATDLKGPTTATTPTALPGGATLANGQPTDNWIEWVQWYDKLGKVKWYSNSGHSVSSSLLTLGVGINSVSVITGIPSIGQVNSTLNDSTNLSGFLVGNEGTGYFYAQAIGYSDTVGTSQFNGILQCDVLTP